MNPNNFRMSRLGAAACLIYAGASFATEAPGPELEAGSNSLPVVLTATRLKQTVGDTPASVTVITSDMLKHYGISSIVDAMRFVPGMEVNVGDGNSFIGNSAAISYHGTNGLDPRRMAVMIDGVSMYQPAFSEVKWDSLPVSIDDIDRIEVVRGPDSAAYGPNSMMAVINIITKHPEDALGYTAVSEVGTNDRKRAMLRYGGRLGTTDFRLTGEHIQAGGFSSSSSALPIFKTDTSTNRISLVADTRFDVDTDLSTTGTLWNGHDGVSRIDPQQISAAPINLSAGYISGTLRHQISQQHEFSLRLSAADNEQTQEWRTAYPEATLLPQAFAMYQANPAYADSILEGKQPSGGTPQDNALGLALIQALTKLGPDAFKLIDVSTNQNFREKRVEVEVQDTYVWSQQLRTVGGLGARYNVGDSATYFGGSVSNYIYWGFGNVEYKINPTFTLNVGGYGETSRLTGANFSPRAALNAKIDSQQTVRFVYSQGTRTPDLHEQRSNWSYTAQDSSDPSFNGARLFESAVSRGRLTEERESSYELGYNAIDPSHGLTFDARAFYEHLYDLISEQLDIGNFHPTNNGHVDLSGIELQWAAAPTPNWSMFATYAYLDNHAPIDSLERTQYARNSGSVGTTYRLLSGMRISVDYARQSSETGIRPIGRLDLNILNTFALGRSTIETTLGASRSDLSTVSTATNLNGLPANPANAGVAPGPIAYSYASRYQFVAKANITF